MHSFSYFPTASIYKARMGDPNGLAKECNSHIPLEPHITGCSVLNSAIVLSSLEYFLEEVVLLLRMVFPI